MKTKDIKENRHHKSTRVTDKKASLLFKRVIKNFVLEDESFLLEKNAPGNWRNRIFYITEFVILIFGAPLMFYGSYMFCRGGRILYAVIEALLYFLSVFVVLNKKINVKLKKYYIAYGLYIFSIFLLLTTGLYGGSMARIVISLILTGCLLEKKQIKIFITINLAVFVLITMLLYSGYFDGTVMETYKEVWLIDGLSSQLCGILLLILMTAIYDGLEKQTQHIIKSETLLTEGEIKHKTMIANISDAIVIIDKEGNITYGSPNLEQRFPWMTKDFIKGSFYDKIHPEDRSQLEEVIKSLPMDNGRQKTVEIRYLTNEKEIGYLELTAVNLTQDPNINGILINFSDITKRKLWEQEIIFLNQHDTLTGLYSRSYFETKKKQLDTEYQLPISIIVGDINGLKIINDSLGHTEGDKLLITIAKIIKKSCRKGDIASRISGDEFQILLPKTNEEGAAKVIRYIYQGCLNYNDNTMGDLYHLSISLGAATKTSKEESLDQLQKLAEDFMYKRKLLEGRSVHSSIISSMKTALFEKSYETEQHAQRLINLSKEVGKAVCLSSQQFDELELLSTLHDIGKIGIDNQILNKPSSLSEEEWIMMRKHSEIGYRIAMASPELVSIAYYILTHHERWDGKGYPQGLAGKEIPLLSRILSLADAYDAMTNDRPYRKAMSKEAAVLEIESNAGTQFDPEVAKIFIDILKKMDT